jgi:hypothetical protein
LPACLRPHGAWFSPIPNVAAAYHGLLRWQGAGRGSCRSGGTLGFEEARPNSKRGGCISWSSPLAGGWQGLMQVWRHTGIRGDQRVSPPCAMNTGSARGSLMIHKRRSHNKLAKFSCHTCKMQNSPSDGFSFKVTADGVLVSTLRGPLILYEWSPDDETTIGKSRTQTYGQRGWYLLERLNT